MNISHHLQDLYNVTSQSTPLSVDSKLGTSRESDGSLISRPDLAAGDRNSNDRLKFFALKIV